MPTHLRRKGKPDSSNKMFPHLGRVDTSAYVSRISFHTFHTYYGLHCTYTSVYINIWHWIKLWLITVLYVCLLAFYSFYMLCGSTLSAWMQFVNILRVLRLHSLKQILYTLEGFSEFLWFIFYFKVKFTIETDAPANAIKSYKYAYKE